MATDTACLYCGSPNDLETEHMPPVCMFIGKQRPAGMEFRACRACNGGTSPADLVASTIARINSTFDLLAQFDQEGTEHVGKLNQIAPGFVDEIMGSSERLVLHEHRGCWRIGHEMHIDGQLVASYLSVFGAKLGMALFRQHVGSNLPATGAVQTTWYTNMAMAENVAQRFINRLPGGGSLRQGRWTVQDQFSYRYSTDGRSTLIAAVLFHDRLFFVVSAVDDERKIGAPLDIPTSTIVRTGQLLTSLPSRKP